MKTTFSILLIALTLIGCSKSKSAFVDTQKLFEDYTEMTEVQDKYTKLTDDVRADLQPKIQAFQIKVDLYQKNAQSMSMAERQTKEQELGALQQEIQQMQQNRGGQIQQESQAAVDSVISKVRKFIDTYGEENGYDFIYGKNESGNVLYGKSELDITDKVLEALNKEYSSGSTEPVKTESPADTTAAE
ncbi:OmpH family outer membrane protein [Leeuwenhoekiella polynyae]|uniref:Periplasmic chaperone for outer membrane proteins Skp n=1 Tax=Leeuwenhoekiella polynyae TaxID=1550906 RepID=A0A4Q0PHK8_9FLAO|nr:OmpH family outer membrane protein [Leeuwenhoekiella polynyae]RXG26425.1 periplasmic chaperone for outer membrane proteins Skp [Leeuwenhoekiella polynyae]